MIVAYDLKMPEAVARFFHYLGLLEIIDLTSFLGRMGCLLNPDFVTQLYTKVSLAAFVVVVLAAWYVVALYIDEDGNGYVDFEELCKWCKMSAAQKWHKRGDGHVAMEVSLFVTFLSYNNENMS